MEFSNKELAERYQMNTGDKDPLVQINGFRGKLSTAKDPEMVEGMISRGSKLVSKREGKSPAKPSAASSSEIK